MKRIAPTVHNVLKICPTRVYYIPCPTNVFGNLSPQQISTRFCHEAPWVNFDLPPLKESSQKAPKEIQTLMSFLVCQGNAWAKGLYKFQPRNWQPARYELDGPLASGSFLDRRVLAKGMGYTKISQEIVSCVGLGS